MRTIRQCVSAVIVVPLWALLLISLCIALGCSDQVKPDLTEIEQAELFAKALDVASPAEQRIPAIARLGSAEHPGHYDSWQVHRKLFPLLKDSSPKIICATCSALAQNINKHKILGIVRLDGVIATLDQLNSTLLSGDASLRLAAIRAIKSIKETHGDYPVVNYHPFYWMKFDEIASKNLFVNNFHIHQQSIIFLSKAIHYNERSYAKNQIMGSIGCILECC